ncbi:MAG: hypothetical protein ABMA64_23705 [Myxococcota bacterium]
MNRVEQRFQSAGIQLQPTDAPGGLQWRSVGSRDDLIVWLGSSALAVERRLGRRPVDALSLLRWSMDWGLGRAAEVEGDLVLTVALPTGDGTDLAPEELEQLVANLDAAVGAFAGDTLVRPPVVPAGGPALDLADLEALFSTLGLRGGVERGFFIVGVDPGDGARFGLKIHVDDRGIVRFQAYLSPLVVWDHPPGIACASLLNRTLPLGCISITPPPGFLACWFYALPSHWLRGRPDRLQWIVDHAAHGTLQVHSAGQVPVREGVVLPMLVPPDALPAEVAWSRPLAAVPGPGVPVVVAVLVDAATGERVEGASPSPQAAASCVQQLAQRLLAWQPDHEDPDLLVVRGPFAAEQILVPSFLQQAHERLGDPLAVALPERGVVWAQAYSGPESVDRLRQRVQRRSGALTSQLFLVSQGRIGSRVVADGEPTFAVLEPVGVRPPPQRGLLARLFERERGSTIRFRFHDGRGPIPLNELEMLAATTMVRRLADGTPIAEVQVQFASTEALEASRSTFARWDVTLLVEA